MSDAALDEMLAAAAGEVLETMFFTEVFAPANPEEREDGPRVVAQVRFDGEPGGVLTASVSERAVRDLAENFLARENDDPLDASQLGGVVCELTNMICGSLLSHVKTETHFRLASPALLSGRADVPHSRPNQSLDVGEGALDLWLSLEQHGS